MNRKILQSAHCAECGIEIQTTYNTHERKVLCEGCYRKMVY